MFKKTGSPQGIDEVIAFDVKHATEIRCPKCKALAGMKSGSAYKPMGTKPEIIVYGWKALCPKCGEAFNV